MISLTDVAAAEVRSAMEAVDNPEVALRVAVQPGGCASLQYDVYLDVAFWDDDMLFEVAGVRVVIDPASAPFLRQATLDILDGPGGPAFAIGNPELMGVCTCAQHCDAQYFEGADNELTEPRRGTAAELPARRRAGRVPVRAR
jgi:iron-sulfur cluster assembly accessory protein